MDKRWCVILIAVNFVAGFLGAAFYGRFESSVLAQSSVAQVTGSSFQLINGLGQKVAVLGVDSRDHPSLALLDGGGRLRAEFALDGANNPIISLKGTAGEDLLWMGVGVSGRPRIVMSEPNFNNRVFLGVADPDAPAPDWKYDQWILRFRGDQGVMAAIGVSTKESGGFIFKDNSGRLSRLPRNSRSLVR